MAYRFISGMRKLREALRVWSQHCGHAAKQRWSAFYGGGGGYWREPYLKYFLFTCYRLRMYTPSRKLAYAVAASLVSAKAKDQEHATQPATVDWSKARLSLQNFKQCWADAEFINSLPHNEPCERCKACNMKYCYCQVGNRTCNDQPNSIQHCKQPTLELNDPDLPDGNTLIEQDDANEWLPYVRRNNVYIWRREEQGYMHAYKLYAHFDDITAEDFLHVQVNLKYRSVWDDSADKLETIDVDKTPQSNSVLIYWDMKWPRFFANRDYVYNRRHLKIEQQKLIIVISNSATHPAYPEFGDKVRVKQYWSIMVIKPYTDFHEPGLHFMLTYFDDPGTLLPQSIKSWVSQNRMPDFINTMYQATKTYAQNRAIKMQEAFNELTSASKDCKNAAHESRSSRLNDLHNLHQRYVNSEAAEQ